MDVGEAIPPALKLKGKPRVIDPKAVQHRCVKVMNVHCIFSDVVAEVVSLAVRQPTLDPSAG
jgi:hypothetical protein